MRRTLAAVAIASIAMLALPAGAAAPTRTGWWWSLNNGPVAPPPPPWVPPGGLYVAGNPGGAEAVSAVFVPLAKGERPALLTLRIADVRGEPVLGACPVIGQWEPAEGGPLAEAPVVDCSRVAIEGVVDAERGTVAFDLSTFPVVDGVDVALQPAAGATFQLAVEKPDASALAVTAALPTTAPTPSGSPAPAAPRQPIAPAFAPPAVPRPSTFVAAPTTTVNTRPPVLAAAPDAIPRPTSGDAEGDPLRVLGIVGLAAVGVLWTVDARRRQRPPRLLFDLPEL